MCLLLSLSVFMAIGSRLLSTLYSFIRLLLWNTFKCTQNLFQTHVLARALLIVCVRGHPLCKLAIVKNNDRVRLRTKSTEQFTMLPRFLGKNTSIFYYYQSPNLPCWLQFYIFRQGQIPFDCPQTMLLLLL